MNNKAFFVPGDDLFLLGCLNSEPFWNSAKRICTALGDEDDGGRVMLQWVNFKRAVLPRAAASESSKISALVSRILKVQPAPGPSDTAALEAEINARVDFLYFRQVGDETFEQWKLRLEAEKGTLAGEVREMIQHDETDAVEFKETLEYVDRLDPNIPADKRNEKRQEMQAVRVHEVLKTICGYINRDGGTLLIGVHNDGTPVGIEPDYKLISAEKDKNPDGFERKLRDLADKRLNKRPIGLLTVRFADLDTKTICRVDVKTGLEPFYLDGDYWVRDGNRTITLVDHERDDYIAKRRASAT